MRVSSAIRAMTSDRAVTEVRSVLPCDGLTKFVGLLLPFLQLPLHGLNFSFGAPPFDAGPNAQRSAAIRKPDADGLIGYRLWIIDPMWLGSHATWIYALGKEGCKRNLALSGPIHPAKGPMIPARVLYSRSYNRRDFLALAMFCNRANFDSYPVATGESCDCDAMGSTRRADSNRLLAGAEHEQYPVLRFAGKLHHSLRESLISA